MQIGPIKVSNDNDFYIMGILNVTPDSFSDGGNYDSVDGALEHCEFLLSEGADIIDIGAESTRPGHEQISTEEEIARLLPILKAIRVRYPDIAISIDCYRAETARAALSAGADMINDIWGLTYDEDMAAAIAESGAAVCVMHNRSDMNYTDLISDVKNDLAQMLRRAEKAGIARSQICIDPGIGFAKRIEENLFVLKHLEELQGFDLPILLGTSRKGFLGSLLEGVPADERDVATAATSVIGYEKGCRIFRVHDVRKTKEALTVARAILEAEYGLCRD
ncbi:MAG: dihydropteroate synthase [Saccharofermentanales bacterium]|nr:dihydropteroate synthase [Eubacteriales bacterium]HHU04149.1 dihydropteroate synthase [Fastidiosipila sp.]